VRVIGDRKAFFGKEHVPPFSDPVPFTTMDLRYERAYGGIDVYSDKKTSYPYPRNPLGRGFIVEYTKEGIENLELPNLEDPNDLLTPDRLCVSEYSRWQDQPMPAGLGWFPKYWRPRAELAGIMPADRPVEQELRKAYSAFLPATQRPNYMKNGIRDMDFRFFNGASPGLVMPYLNGNEEIATANLAGRHRLIFPAWRQAGDRIGYRRGRQTNEGGHPHRHDSHGGASGGYRLAGGPTLSRSRLAGGNAKVGNRRHMNRDRASMTNFFNPAYIMPAIILGAALVYFLYYAVDKVGLETQRDKRRCYSERLHTRHDKLCQSHRRRAILDPGTAAAGFLRRIAQH
jgi:hypothetical protein